MSLLSFVQSFLSFKKSTSRPFQEKTFRELVELWIRDEISYSEVRAEISQRSAVEQADLVFPLRAASPAPRRGIAKLRKNASFIKKIITDSLGGIF